MSIDAEMLWIAGQRRLPAAARAAIIHRLEIPYGRFERQIRLPSARLRARPVGARERLSCRQPDETRLRRLDSTWTRPGRPQTAAAEGRASHPPLPQDALIILPVRQTVLFPGMVCHWRSGGRHPSLPRRRRSAPSGRSASFCRPIPRSRIRSPSSFTRSGQVRRFSAMSRLRTARIMWCARACGAFASPNSFPAIRFWSRVSRRSVSPRC